MSTIHTKDGDVRTASAPSAIVRSMKVTSTSVWSKRKVMFAASATALGAIGIFAGPLPAPANAACSEFAFSNAAFQLKQSVGGATVTLPATNDPTHVYGNARSVDRHGHSMDGTVDGNIVGRDMTLQISWNSGSYGQYIGTIADDGSVHGQTQDANSPANKGTWDSLTSLVCAPPKPDVDDQNKKPPPPATAPTDAVDFSFGDYDFTKALLPVTVTNSAPIAGTCTYDSTPGNYHKEFDIAPNGTANFNIENVYPTGTTYRITVACVGDFNGQRVQFGHKVRLKTF